MFRRIKEFLISLENPLYLSKRVPWLYWAIFRFSWSDYIWLLDNPLTRYSIVASAAGYLIYLNDFLSQKYGFDFVTNGAASVFGLDMRAKLSLIYFGLVFVAIGRAIYLTRRPHVISHGPSQSEWVAFGLQNFVYSDYLSMHDTIQNNHRTLYGKYYTDDWDAFEEDSIWKESGRSEGMDTVAKRSSRGHVGFTQAKQRHEGLLRCILIDRYCEVAATRKLSLFLSVFFSSIGSLMFLLPSVDLFLSLLRSFL